MSINTSTLATAAGAELKSANVVVDPSPVADTLDIVGAVPLDVANEMYVDPSVQPSYAPVSLLNLITPVAPVGLCEVLPTGNLQQLVEPPPSNS